MVAILLVKVIYIVYQREAGTAIKGILQESHHLLLVPCFSTCCSEIETFFHLLFLSSFLKKILVSRF